MSEEASVLQVVAVAALVFRGERLLAMRRSARREVGAGLWEGLSGRVEAGEEPLAAVRREIVEESGLTVTVDPRPITAYAARRAGAPMIVVVYRARHLAGEVILSDEHDAFAWLTPADFAARSTLTPLVEAARQAAGLP